MYILSIDTTGPVGSAAVMNTDTGEIRMEFTLAPMEHLKNLMVLTQKLLKEQSLAPRDLAAPSQASGSAFPAHGLWLRL